MKKYLGPILGIMAFASFITYASVQTKPATLQESQEEIVQQIEPLATSEYSEAQDAIFATTTSAEAIVSTTENFTNEDSVVVPTLAPIVEQTQPVINNPTIPPDVESSEEYDYEDNDYENEEEDSDDD